MIQTQRIRCPRCGIKSVCRLTHHGGHEFTPMKAETCQPNHRPSPLSAQGTHSGMRSRSSVTHGNHSKTPD